MEDESLLSLEKRIANIEKSLGISEDEPNPKVKFEDSEKKSLISKVLFAEYKTKEVFIAQIQSLIEKEKSLSFIIRNNENITQTYDILKQKLEILLLNEDFLKKAACELKKIREGKQFLDFVLLFRLNDNMERVRWLMERTAREKEEFIEVDERLSRCLNTNEMLVSELNGHLLALDSLISQREKI